MKKYYKDVNFTNSLISGGIFPDNLFLDKSLNTSKLKE